MRDAYFTRLAIEAIGIRDDDGARKWKTESVLPIGGSATLGKSCDFGILNIEY